MEYKYKGLLTLRIVCILVFTAGYFDNKQVQVNAYIKSAKKSLSEKKERAGIIEYKMP